MLTQDEYLVSVSVAVQYKIGNLEAYLFNVTDPLESLQQATSSALREVMGSNKLNDIITEQRMKWGNELSNNLKKILSKYKTGLLVVNVAPQPARAPESVQDAFDDAIKAQEDEKRFKEQAQAYSQKVVNIADGKAKRIVTDAEAQKEAIVLRARGDVAEFSKLLPEYIAAPEVTSERMYLTAIQDVLTNSSKVVVDKKSGNLLYLPLDKIMNHKSQASPKQATNLDSYVPMKPQDNGVARNTQRPNRNM